jgi:hypothetical protein
LGAGRNEARALTAPGEADIHARHLVGGRAYLDALSRPGTDRWRSLALMSRACSCMFWQISDTGERTVNHKY